jgi:predicted nicotinamide N-methyase
MTVRDTDPQRTRELLERRFRIAETAMEIAGRRLTIAHPANPEELIDEEDFNRDERLPYWADLWPSSRILGEHLLAMEGAGRTLLELGCGAGLVTSCAAAAGFDVTATDYYDDALRFTRVNAWVNAGATIRTRMVDWRNFPQDLGRFDLVVASDILYERTYGALVARAIARSLAPTGEALLADPGRVALEPFLEAARGDGLVVAARDRHVFEEGKVRQTITLFHLRLTRSETA